jgi:mannose-6-phosphate isomerase-like protein (cupin superfamily)
MSTHTVKHLSEMDAMFHGSFKRAASELGVESFGMNVIDMPPNADRHPEHDHAEKGEEEVYVAMRGSGRIVVEGEEVALDEDTMVRVAANAKRKVFAGPDGLRLLVVGGVPGGPYTRAEIFSKGGPDPTAR